MDCTSVFLRISGQEQYVIFMINKENHGEKNFILLNLKQLASVVWWCWWVVCVFGHNYKGFVRAFRMKKIRGGTEPPE